MPFFFLPVSSGPDMWHIVIGVGLMKGGGREGSFWKSLVGCVKAEGMPGLCGGE